MNSRIRMRQLVDWPAAFWAGLSGAAIFLFLSIVLPWLVLGDAWIIVRLIASLALGPGVIPPQDPMPATIPLVAILVLFLLSALYSALVAFVVHRWGLIVSFFAGAVVGLALYWINFYTLSYFFPWVFPLRNWMLLVAHVLFGALVGVIYELLEVEEFVPVAEPSTK